MHKHAPSLSRKVDIFSRRIAVESMGQRRPRRDATPFWRGVLNEDAHNRPALTGPQQPAIRFLVESALRKLVENNESAKPRTRADWVAYFADALMSETDTSYKSAISSLVASGVSTDEIHQYYVPAAARFLGELWVADRASFVDVTVGAGRLQSLFRDAGEPGDWLDRSIPLGQSVLMVLPPFEDHSLGGFVAADHMRRHGLWVHMAISLDNWELAQLLRTNRFGMVGITVATWQSVEGTAEIVEYLRKHVSDLPPIAIGGRAVDDAEAVVKTSGADFAVRSAREAIERCGLATVAPSLYASEGA